MTPAQQIERGTLRMATMFDLVLRAELCADAAMWLMFTFPSWARLLL